MSDYKNIRGKKIKFFTSDLSGETSEGQLFYSDTDNQFKSIVASAVWSAGGNNITKHYAGAGGGTQTAGVIFGGNDGSSPLNNTTEYNGAGFSLGGDLTNARYTLGGGGTQTAALAFGGNSPGPTVKDLTEEWNGASWVEVADLSTARDNLAGSGTASAALAFGGVPPSPAGVVTEEWSSSSDVVKTLTD